MRSEDGSSFFLLACFSAFYEEVAVIKQAFADGKLASCLAIGDETPPTYPPDVAARVAGRLLAVVSHQAREVRGSASAVEAQAHAKAQYAMAALADEIFLLELPWSAREAWLDNLLEKRLFRSCSAGQQFYDLVDLLLESRDRSALQIDLASVYLLALQLGFKGIYRGQTGAEKVRRYREELFRIVRGTNGMAGSPLAFPQAYQHVLVGRTDLRLAPLSPWLSMAKFAAIGYGVLSTVAWAALLYPFVRAFGG